MLKRTLVSPYRLYVARRGAHWTLGAARGGHHRGGEPIPEPSSHAAIMKERENRDAVPVPDVTKPPRSMRSIAGRAARGLPRATICRGLG